MTKDDAVEVAENYLRSKYAINKKSHSAVLFNFGNEIRFAKKRATWEVYFYNDGGMFSDFIIYVDDKNEKPWDAIDGCRTE